MKHITQQEWLELLKQDNNAIILDVRTPEEQAQGIMKNAICMDIYEPESFMEALEKLDKTKNYYVYCKAGGRSANACQVMDQMNFAQTYNLLGGTSLWTEELVKP